MERYRKISVLGRGATAHVWLAEGPDGLVAIKVAHQTGALLREIAAMQRVSHPYVAPLLDADPNGDWLVTRHAPLGVSSEWAVNQPIPTLVDFVARVGEALDALHRVGMLHGDLKPSNVLVGQGAQPLLVDLGSAVEAGSVPGGGTPGFTAPERLRAGPASVQTDLWGLGAVLYTLVCERAPFVRDDASALAWAPLVDLPEPPSATRPSVPAGLEDLVLQLLAHRPEARGSSARLAVAELRASLSTAPRSPIVGMAKERTLLRRAVVDVIGGGRGMFVLHGLGGSGRRALIRECVQTARREGIRIVPAGDRNAILGGLGSGPSVLAVDGGAPGTEALLAQILKEGASALTLVRSERPLPELGRRGARHLQPPRLSADEVSAIVQAHGYDQHRAGIIFQRSQGLPGAVVGMLNPTGAANLTPVATAVMQHLRGGALTVPVLARRMSMGEHQLLDLVEPMMDRGLVTASADGVWLSMNRS